MVIQLPILWASIPALLRVLIFFLVWLACWLPLAVPLALALQWRPPQPIAPAQKLPLLASLYAILPPLLWGIAVLQGESFAAYGLPGNVSVLRSVAWGWLFGVLGLAVMFGIQFGFGWLQWHLIEAVEIEVVKADSTSLKRSAWGWVSPVLLTLAVGLWVSWTEELVFRGWLLNTLQADYAPWLAAAIASLIFALLHLIWEGQENIPQLPGLWLMGMVLTIARWVDGGNLGLAWGLHTGWIWVIASLDTLGLIRYSGKAPAWVTGLGGKPLAGMMGLLFLLTTGGLLWLSSLL